MITIEVKLHSAIDDSRSRRLGFMTISNTGDHPQHPKKANYKVSLYKISKDSSISKKPYKEGIIYNWSRDNKSPMQLVQKCLNEVL